MPATQHVTFDKLGVTYSEPTYWVNEHQPMALAHFLAHFLVPDVGEAWLLHPATGWVEVREDNWEKVANHLEKLVQVWKDGQDGAVGFADFLTEEGRCAIFLDAERFRSCFSDGLDIPESMERFYVGFEVDWSFLQGAEISCLSPHLRVTNYWPNVERWAPQRPGEPIPEPLSPEDAANLLEDGLWETIAGLFRALRDDRGLSPISIDVGHGNQQPPVFYFATPLPLLQDGASYLGGSHLKALNTLGHQLLASTDMRSTEITGGVMERCLAVFRHCPNPRAEYYLIVPTAGAAEAEIESKIHFLADKIQFIDLDATQDVKDIVTDLESGQTFSPIWKGSAESGLKLIKLLYSLLPKISIQDRMFSLTHIMSSFLTKLQTRSQESSMHWDTLRSRLASSMEASHDFAQRAFTVQPIPGVEMLGISEGRTRTNQKFADILDYLVGEAKTLPEKFSQINISLNHTATLEERKREREKKRILEAEEAAAKRLNLVLAAVAGLAAIPLLFGQYDVQTLMTRIGHWFPFGLGVHVSFLAGLATLLGIGLVLGVNYLRSDRSIELHDSPLVTEVAQLSDTLFDGYRSYQHGTVKKAIFKDIQPSAYIQENVWDEGSDEEKAARELVHTLDKQLAETAALAMDKSYAWDEDNTLPQGDEAWAEDLEKKICRFVLLGDVIDLRPENLHLPLSLALYRYMYRRSGLSSPPVSKSEFDRVLNSFGYSDKEVLAVESWVRERELEAGTAVEFVRACLEEGITALHKRRLVEVQEEDAEEEAG
jgi:hypothetical protein